MYGEVEFNTEEEAKAFKWPFGEVEDVTYNKFYKWKITGPEQDNSN